MSLRAGYYIYQPHLRASSAPPTWTTSTGASTLCDSMCNRALSCPGACKVLRAHLLDEKVALDHDSNIIRNHALSLQGAYTVQRARLLNEKVLPPCTLRPIPSALHPTPCTLRPTPYTLHPAPYTLHPTPCALHPTPYTLHPTPYTLHPTPCALHPTPCTGRRAAGHPDEQSGRQSAPLVTREGVS